MRGRVGRGSPPASPCVSACTAGLTHATAAGGVVRLRQLRSGTPGGMLRRVMQGLLRQLVLDAHAPGAQAFACVRLQATRYLAKSLAADERSSTIQAQLADRRLESIQQPRPFAGALALPFRAAREHAFGGIGVMVRKERGVQAP